MILHMVEYDLECICATYMHDDVGWHTSIVVYSRILVL